MYSKLFDSMYDGTLRTRSPWQALVTFQQMLILCDPTGVCDMTPDALAFRTGIPLEIIQVGIAALEAPDPDSRLPNDEGRRIVRLDDHRNWGWRITNFVHYRGLQSNEGRREYQREWQRNRRANGKSKDASRVVDTCRQSLTAVDQIVTRNVSVYGFDLFWTAYPKKEGKLDARKAWTKLKPDDDLRATILRALEAKKRTWTDRKYIPLPATWLNGARWEDELEQRTASAQQHRTVAL